MAAAWRWVGMMVEEGGLGGFVLTGTGLEAGAGGGTDSLSRRDSPL